jgi:hypothetical protein
VPYPVSVAKPTKRRIDGDSSGTSRTTPKGGNPSKGKAASDASSTRYTPPAPRKQDMPSSPWVTGLMFAFFGVGFLGIFLNYTEILPGSPSGWWLVSGLGCILAGIITATQLR